MLVFRKTLRTYQMNDPIVNKKDSKTFLLSNTVLNKILPHLTK